MPTSTRAGIINMAEICRVGTGKFPPCWSCVRVAPSKGGLGAERVGGAYSLSDRIRRGGNLAARGTIVNHRTRSVWVPTRTYMHYPTST